MQSKTVYTTTRRDAKKECPWAAKIVKVDGGYRCFATLSDYHTWAKQK